MNNLSYSLYLIEVLSNLQSVLRFISVMVGIVGCAMFVMYIFWKLDDEIQKYPLGWLITYLIFMLVIISVIVVIPSRQTMYLIAASQVGEQIIKLEEVQELGGEVGELTKDTISLLRERVDEELKEK